jgi:hypothetical protein
MKPWMDRPREVAFLLNPAFCAAAVGEVAKGYQDEASGSIELPLLFVAIPLALHLETRAAFPRSIATRHNVWLESHQELRVGFADRCRSIAPYVREAIVFGGQHGVFSVTTDGRLTLSRASRRSVGRNPDSQDVAATMKAAKFVGRWLASAGPTNTVFALWGVRP